MELGAADLRNGLSSRINCGINGAVTLDIPDGETIVCGMTLGYADMTQPENTLETERADLDEFAAFY